MHPFVVPAVILAVLYYAYEFLSRTDIPKIKGLPELPAVPVFGSLLHLGKYHARNCAKLVDTYGPVFQVRLGNRVCYPRLSSYRNATRTNNSFPQANHLRQYLRLRERNLDRQPIRPNLPSTLLDFPQCCLQDSRSLHPWHIAVERILQESA